MNYRYRKIGLPIAIAVVAIWLVADRSDTLPRGSDGEQVDRETFRTNPINTSLPDQSNSLVYERVDNVVGPESRLVQIMTLPDISDVPVADEYQELVQRANNGDSVAAHVLWKKLGRCKGNISTGDQLEFIINDMQQTYQIEDQQTGERYGVNNIQPHIDQLRADSVFCAGLRPEQAEEDFYWLEMAADAGYLPAAIDFATFAPVDVQPGTEAADEYLQKRSVHLTRAWEGGNVDALFWIGMDYYNGVVTERNLAEAYARLLAVQNSRAGTGKYEALDALVSSIGNQLSPHEMQTYAVLSDELLKNPNCCIFISTNSRPPETQN